VKAHTRPALKLRHVVSLPLDARGAGLERGVLEAAFGAPAVGLPLLAPWPLRLGVPWLLLPLPVLLLPLLLLLLPLLLLLVRPPADAAGSACTAN
jgi:hypothetical protein